MLRILSNKIVLTSLLLSLSAVSSAENYQGFIVQFDKTSSVEQNKEQQKLKNRSATSAQVNSQLIHVQNRKFSSNPPATNSTWQVTAYNAQGSIIEQVAIDNPFIKHIEIFNPATGALELSDNIDILRGFVDVTLTTKAVRLSLDNNGVPQTYQNLTGQTLSPPPISSADNVIEVEKNGDSSNRVDLVFVSEGYTEEELPQFADDVASTVAGYFSFAPYEQYRAHYNLWRVEVASNESGVGTGGVPIDTAFGGNFGCYGIDRLLCVDEGLVLDYVASVMPANQMDQILVIVNSETYGGAGGTVATMSVNEAAIGLALHEVGHSFGFLADEYITNPELCNLDEPLEPNVTNDSTGAKWQHWFGIASNVGAVEGARYCPEGMYKPTENSMMLTLGAEFFAVNEEALILRTYDYTSPLDNAIPEEAEVTISSDGQEFTANHVATTPNTVNITWYVDDVEICSGYNTLNVDPAGRAADINVKAVVEDIGYRVIKDTNNKLKAEQNWVLHNSGDGSGAGDFCSNAFEVDTSEYPQTDCSVDAPEVPSNASVSDITPTSFRLNWDSASCADSYLVWVWADEWKSYGPTTETSIVIDQLTPGTHYGYNSIRAVNDNGTTDTGYIAGYTSCAVTDLSYSDLTASGLTLNWNLPECADEVTVIQLNGGSEVELITTTSNSFVVTGLAESTKYDFIVRTTSSQGSVDTSIMSPTVASPPPIQPESKSSGGPFSSVLILLSFGFIVVRKSK